MPSPLLLLTLSAQAHGPVSELLAIRMEADTARVSLVTPADAFASVGADTDGDGLLSVAEVREAREALLAALDAGLTLSGGRRTFGDVLVAGTDDASDHLQLILQYRWDAPPESVMLRYDLLGSDGASLPVLISDEQAGVRRQGTLTAAAHRARIRGERPAEAPDEALWLAGVRHVAEGLDHILFIAALVLAAPRLRRLLGPISAFTVSHTLALTAVAFGLAPTLPGWLIEAGIAASVAGLALIDLSGRPARRLWLLTGLCGLVHGLGFAGALSESLGGLSGLAGTLVELTAGIEVAQLAVAGLSLLAISGLSRLSRWAGVRLALAGSIGAVGVAWTVERLAAGIL